MTSPKWVVYAASIPTALTLLKWSGLGAFLVSFVQLIYWAVAEGVFRVDDKFIPKQDKPDTLVLKGIVINFN
jgi:hypothetical protein